MPNLLRLVYDVAQTATWYHSCIQTQQWTACWPVCIRGTAAVARYRPSYLDIARSTNPAIIIAWLMWSLIGYRYQLSAALLTGHRILLVPKLAYRSDTNN